MWAFGVTLWEMFSYGCIPYADVGSDREVYQLVVSGERLPKPRECPEAVFKVMQACWQKRPEDRPTFRMSVSGVCDGRRGGDCSRMD